MAQTHSLRRVLILADESSDWIVAGLRQLDRLALSLNEFQGEPLIICIFWTPHLDQSQRWVPKDERLTNVVFTTDVDGGSFDLVLGTRLFLYRNPVPQLMEASLAPSGLPRHDEKELWEIYSHHLETFPCSRDGTWEYITSAGQIGDVERRFLVGSGKSQDGFVSRYLNRPISRVVTRLLLRFSTTPNAWTLLIFSIPLVASLILLHGTYWSFLWGLVLFQVFSVLDGCDGEIARAKFLESERGRRLDDLCDILSNILLVVGLGFGLFRQASLVGGSGWFYAIEGLAAAALIGMNELLLSRRKPRSGAARSTSLGDALYPRHRELVERSGMLRLGETFAYWVIQLTKRDVALLGFVLLAAIGQPAWILHLLLAVTAISLVLALKTFAQRSAP
jgi:hypothetical protein